MRKIISWLVLLFLSINYSMGRLPVNADTNPGYTSDETGTYPSNSWKPSGQENVLNFQGDDGKTEWDGNPENNKESYLEHYDQEENYVTDIRKYAKETATPGLFDVYLNVRGKEIAKTTDVVFVNDLSGSMNQDIYGTPKNSTDKSYIGDSKIKLQNDAMRTMLTALQNEANLNVGFVGFSSNHTKEDVGGSTIKKPRVDYKGNNNIIPIQPVNQAATNIINYLNPLDIGVKEQGGTFTQKALIDAQHLLASSQANRKLIILMTDGQPSVSYPVTGIRQLSEGTFNDTVITKGAIAASYKVIQTPVALNTQPGDLLEMPMTSEGSTGFWYSGTLVNSTAYSKTAPYLVDGVRINSPWHALLGTAYDIKATGTEIYGMGMNITENYVGHNDEGISLKKEDIINAFKDLTTGDDHYKEVDTPEDLQDFTRNIIASLSVKTLVNATITDPIGEQYLYETPPAGLQAKSVGSKEINNENLPVVSYDEENKQITSTPFTLGEGEEIQIHYQVRINTEANNFKPDYWYPMNGTTTVNVPNKEGLGKTDIYEFGVPSGKAPGVTLDLKKEWEEYDKDSSTRPDFLDFLVERQALTKGSDGWQSAYVRLTKDQNWQRTNIKQVSAIAGENYLENLFLPKYNNQGTDFVYSITKEVDVPDGYESSNDGNTWTNKKIFTPFDLKIQKVSTQGDLPLTGAKFKLKKKDSSEATIELIDNGDGTYNLPDDANKRLQLNSSYELTEVSPPPGYQPTDRIWEIKVNKKGEVTIDDEAVDIEGNLISYTIQNEFLKRPLIVEKYVQGSDTPLEGAKFTLKKYDEAWQGEGEVVDSLIGNDPASYEELLPGYYSLQETTTPDHFKPDDTLYKFQIDLYGRLFDESGQELKATERPTGDGWYLKQEDDKEKLVFVKYNQLRDYNFSILKENAHSGEKLAGAKFSLATKNAPNVELATLTTLEDGTGQFVTASGDPYVLTPGSYFIKEVSAPEGYVLLAGIFEVELNEIGQLSVTYDGQEMPEDFLKIDSSSSDNILVTLTIANTQKGQLPITGGQGIKTFIQIASIFALAIGGIAIYYVWRNKKEANVK